ncbi:MAG TPA: response regulator [Oligoflexia bacterium]|nr:response regulator [Oligoflexia bacterium]HMP47910.1 response regulator [Oligoflexia bacterium]
MKSALIVDDDPMIHLLVSKMLEAKGFFVTGYKSCDEVRSSIDVITVSEFSVILLDMQIGNETGDTVFDLIEKCISNLPPVVYMSSNSEVEAREMFELRAKNSLFMQKPFPAGDLYSTLKLLNIEI